MSKPAKVLQSVVNPLVHDPDPGPALEFLKTHQLIPSQARCEVCQKDMSWYRLAQSGGIKYGWRCHNRECPRRSNRQSPYQGNCIFHGSKMSPQIWVQLLYLWAERYPVRCIMDQTGCSRPAVSRAIKTIRCTLRNYFRMRGTFRLGGQNVRVECDETHFAFKRKYHRGRGYTSSPCWVFGMVDCSTSPSTGWCEILPNVPKARGKDAMHALIQRHVRPGSAINTDMWKGYCDIRKLREGYTHDTVNHSKYFVNPANRNAHTQHIESYWAKTKQRISAMRGLRHSHLELFLRECSWRDMNHDNTFMNLLNTIAEVWVLYPSAH